MISHDEALEFVKINQSISISVDFFHEPFAVLMHNSQAIICQDNA
jgi:hypothetical protein